MVDKKQPPQAPAPAPDAAEREHCERVAFEDVNSELYHDLVVEALIRERAAARQEGYNAHLEQLAKHAQPTEDELDHCERVAEVLWTKARSLFEMSECLLHERAAVRAEYEAKLKSAREAIDGLNGALEVLTDAEVDNDKLQREGAEPDWKQAYQNLKRVAERVEKDFGPATCECSSWDALRTELALDPEQGGGGR